jgi:hypothetical protein
MNQQLVEFYKGIGTDNQGRLLTDMHKWSDAKLEGVHDYIQWMFPLQERSQFNLSAPLLDQETIQEFETNLTIRTNMLRSFLRILDFFGFQWKMDGGIIRANNFREKAANWLTPNNHNHLRITRILRCLYLTGNQNEANMFLEALEAVYKDSGKITAQSFGFWKAAVR